MKKSRILRNVTMTISIATERKNLIRPIWEMLRTREGFVGCVHEEDGRTSFASDLHIDLWPDILKKIDLIKDFYPEAKVKLEVECYY